jgi:hypothetical protein
MFAIPDFDIIAGAGPEVKIEFDQLSCVVGTALMHAREVKLGRGGAGILPAPSVVIGDGAPQGMGALHRNAAT